MRLSLAGNLEKPILSRKLCKLDRRHTGRLRKRDNLLMGEGKEGGGLGAKSYDRKKAWAFTNHSILSGPQS